MNSEHNLLKEEGYRLVGAAFEVYNELGAGLSEEVYQESLELELGFRGIPFRSKFGIRTFYKGVELRKHYVPDLILYEGLIVELKAVSDLVPEHEAQLINYMNLTRSRAGYLVNFGHKETLEWKRYVISSARHSTVPSHQRRLA